MRHTMQTALQACKYPPHSSGHSMQAATSCKRMRATSLVLHEVRAHVEREGHGAADDRLHECALAVGLDLLGAWVCRLSVCAEMGMVRG